MDINADILQKRITRLQQHQSAQGSFVPQESWNQFRVAPTCPPSTRLHVRGGRLYTTYNPTWASIDDWEYRAWTVPDLTADVADPTSVTVDVVFANENYFQLFLLELRSPKVYETPGPSDWWFYLHGTGEEFPTAAEAESWLDSETFQYSGAWKVPAEIDYSLVEDVAYPLCGLVLRNDGAVGPSAILPIDYVNRGRSYMWPPDMRPITSIYD